MVCYCYTSAQTNWVLKKEKEGIQVFVTNQENSKFKAIRVLCSLPGTMEQLISVLQLVQIQPQWVVSTKNAYSIKQVSVDKFLYYAEVDLPWPINNRDMVIDLSFVQDPKTKILSIYANTIDHILPEIEGKQRVPYSAAKWLVKSEGNHKISIDYTIKIDPGGGIPAWMVNLFIAKAPYESFKNLTKLIQEKRFQGQHYSFLKD